MRSSSISPPVVETCFEGEVLGPDQAAKRFLSPANRDRLLDLGALRRDPGGQFRIAFVGLAVAGGRDFQFVPKILDGSAGSHREAMRDVVRALRHYARWQPPYHEPSPFLRPDPAAPELSALALADWIIKDYLAAGIYRRTADRYDLDGTGQVSWSRTLERVPPIFVRGAPVYVSLVTRSATRDTAHFVSRLHRQFVEEASARFGHLLGLPPIALDHEPFERFAEVPSLALCGAYLRREAQSAYSDRAMQLLPMLLAWVTGQATGSGTDLSLYGTTTFHNVWEEACVAALGNERGRWKDDMPAPIWTGAGGATQAADRFIPDIVTTLEEPQSGAGWLLIADAKYYRLRMPPGLRGQPGVNDVAKQLWYEEVLRPASEGRGYAQISNIFVLPGSDDEPVFWREGQVAMAGLGASRVLVTRLAFRDALRRYVEARRLDSGMVRAAVSGVSLASAPGGEAFVHHA